MKQNSIQNTRGRIEVITGCMYSGKTGELLRRLRHAQIANQNIAVFTPKIDTRYDLHSIASHNGQSYDATVIPDTDSGIETIQKVESDVVAIDEFNFLSEAFIPTITELADSGTRVVISGLDQTFRGDPFTPMNDVLSIADSVDKLHAVCEVCGNTATRSQRLIDGEPATHSEPTIQVGGSESYEARCRNCHTVPKQ